MIHKNILSHRKKLLTWNFYILTGQFKKYSGTDYLIKIFNFTNSFIDTVAGRVYSIIQTINGSITANAQVLIGISEFNKHEYTYGFSDFSKLY